MLHNLYINELDNKSLYNQYYNLRKFKENLKLNSNINQIYKILILRHLLLIILKIFNLYNHKNKILQAM